MTTSTGLVSPVNLVFISWVQLTAITATVGDLRTLIMIGHMNGTAQN
jgi:hypothetical protein